MASALPESREELLRQLEQMIGRSFRTSDDVRRFVAEAELQRAAEQRRSATGWRAVKSITLLVLLILSFLQYYVTDALLQTASLREMTFFVPVKTDLRS
jgi:hypothetical protein